MIARGNRLIKEADGVHDIDYKLDSLAIFNSLNEEDVQNSKCPF